MKLNVVYRRKFHQERIPCQTEKLNSVPQRKVEVLRLPQQVERLPVDVMNHKQKDKVIVLDTRLRAILQFPMSCTMSVRP